jgi:hypothetical protein
MIQPTQTGPAPEMHEPPRAVIGYSLVQTLTALIAPSASLRDLKGGGPTSTTVLDVGFCSTMVHFFVVVSWTM